MALVGAGAGIIGFPTAATGASARPPAMLTADFRGAPLDFSAAALSRGVLVAGAPSAPVGPNQGQAGAYLFTKPRGGWANEPPAARLVASPMRAQFGSAVAISGNTVVVGYGGASGNVLYVFTRPSGGWFGTVAARARLTVRGLRNGPLGPFAVSRNTIVVSAAQSKIRGNGAIYVFRKPPRGWTGRVHQSARLKLRRGTGDLGSAVAISGANIFVGGIKHHGRPAIYVFHRPRRGWLGIVPARARLSVPAAGVLSSLAAASSYVVAGVSRANRPPASAFVFSKPRRGWAGQIRPRARLSLEYPLRSGYPSGILASLAASKTSIAAVIAGPISADCSPTDVCGESVFTFTRPPLGWRGVIAAGSSLRLPVGTVGFPLALEGHSLAAGGAGGIDIFTQPI